LELCMIIKMSHMNGAWLESTNGFDIFYEELDKLTTRHDQQIYLMSHINYIKLSQTFKLYVQTIWKNI
jgi:hypothetical protein